MTPADARRRDRREEVDDAAVRIFCAKGFAAASVRDIAEEVGVLKGSLYHYISGKDDLLARIFDDAHAATKGFMDEVASGDDDPAGRLLRFCELQVGWNLSNPERARVIARERRFLTGRRAATVTRRRQALEAFVCELVQACAPHVDVRHAMHFVLGALDATPEWYRRDGADSPERIAGVYADLTLGALRRKG